MNHEFANAYQEILLDNVTAIIKQNFIFQTQLKLAENVGNENVELKKRVEELLNELNIVRMNSVGNSKYSEMCQENELLNKELHRLSDVEQRLIECQSALNDSMANSDKSDRLQILLNESLKSEDKLRKVVSKQENELASLKDYIATLEGNVAPSKLKKLQKDVVVEDGSSF